MRHAFRDGSYQAPALAETAAPSKYLELGLTTFGMCPETGDMEILSNHWWLHFGSTFSEHHRLNVACHLVGERIASTS